MERIEIIKGPKPGRYRSGKLEAHHFPAGLKNPVHFLKTLLNAGEVADTEPHHDGIEGIYIVTMPMTAEAAVVGGRETFGEPKKIADIRFDRKGDDLHASVSRMGMIYLAFDGRVGKSLPGREFVEHAYCFKAFPSCEQDKTFDYDPLLVRLEWRQKHDVVHELDGKLLLGESPLDPVSDVPVRKLVRLEYEEGTTQSNGKVLRPVPGEWVLPFLHQRYDDTSGAGIEI